MATLSDPGKDGQVNDYATSVDYKLPTVTVEKGYSTPLSLTGDKDAIIVLSDKQDDGGGSQADVPTASWFTVTPSDIKALEKKIMDELNTQVDEFASFKALIADTEDWIFLVQTPYDLIPHEQATPTGYTSLSAGYTPDSDRPNFTDPNPDDTKKIVNTQNSMVQMVAESYRLMGEVVALFNNAAQQYVGADKAVFNDGMNFDDLPVPHFPGIVIE
ncbi:hypothetical protein GCM10023322_08370 [Rugosimonospora acidiphila]|uniref:Uncharacterized protein n=1 Tax=Rugosimonospora acidiphila TaxID=556531 RepID=A0ABP9RKN1_9ACTN